MSIKGISRSLAFLMGLAVAGPAYTAGDYFKIENKDGWQYTVYIKEKSKGRGNSYASRDYTQVVGAGREAGFDPFWVRDKGSNRDDHICQIILEGGGKKTTVDLQKIPVYDGYKVVSYPRTDEEESGFFGFHDACKMVIKDRLITIVKK